MGAGGIIHQRASVLIGAGKDPSLYDSLPSHEKAEFDSISAKDPLTFTQSDLENLVKVLRIAIRC